MKFCWHDWSRWEDIDWFEKISPIHNKMVGVVICQRRYCYKCNMKKIRTIQTRL